MSQLVKLEKRFEDAIEKLEFALSNKIMRKEVSGNFNEKEKRIILTQSSPSDWVLFSSTNLQGWRIDFLGLERNQLKNPTEEQRFNYRGLTGCLNFYNSEFNNTEINVIYGGCEDSLNLVNSSGKLKSVAIRNAYADALDIDFSKGYILEKFVKLKSQNNGSPL